MMCAGAHRRHGADHAPDRRSRCDGRAGPDTRGLEITMLLIEAEERQRLSANWPSRMLAVRWRARGRCSNMTATPKAQSSSARTELEQGGDLMRFRVALVAATAAA